MIFCNLSSYGMFLNSGQFSNSVFKLNKLSILNEFWGPSNIIKFLVGF